MDCDRCQEIISARLDGEERPGEWEAAGLHLVRCAECRSFEATAGALHPVGRLAPADVVPDLSAAILAAAGPAVARARAAGDVHRTLRVTLALVGLVQIAFALPALLGAEGGMAVHASRHLGSFDIALAVGFLYVAWRPSRALAGVFPVAAALVVCLAGTSLLDVIAQRTGAIGELPHVSEVVGLVALWLLSPPQRSRSLWVA